MLRRQFAVSLVAAVSALKLGPADARAAYLAMSPGKRRTYLDGQLAGKTPSLAAVADWKGARSTRSSGSRAATICAT